MQASNVGLARNPNEIYYKTDITLPVPNRIHYNLSNSYAGSIRSQSQTPICSPQFYSFSSQTNPPINKSQPTIPSLSPNSTPNLAHQFNKPMLLKKGSMNDNNTQIGNFKKKQPQLNLKNKVHFQVGPLTHRTANEPIQNATISRSVSATNKGTKGNNHNSPVKFTISNQQSGNNLIQRNQGMLAKSYQTPKFNYQSPTLSIDFNNSLGSQGNNGLANSFQLYGSINQSK